MQEEVGTLLESNSGRKRIQEGIYEGRGNETLFFGFLGNLRSLHTQLAYKRDLEVFASYLKETFSQLTFLTVRHEHAVAYRHYLESFGGREGNPAAKKTVNRRLSSLKKFYRFLCQRQLLEKNPLEFIDLLKIDSKVKTEALTHEQWKMLMEGNPRGSFTESLHQAVIAMLFTTGMRKSELLNLKVGSLQKKEELLFIEYMAKGSKVLRKPLHPQCSLHLLRYLKLCKDRGYSLDAEAWLFRGTAKREGELREEKLNPSSLDYIVQKAGKKLD